MMEFIGVIPVSLGLGNAFVGSVLLSSLRISVFKVNLLTAQSRRRDKKMHHVDQLRHWSDVVLSHSSRGTNSCAFFTFFLTQTRACQISTRECSDPRDMARCSHNAGQITTMGESGADPPSSKSQER